MKNALKYLAFPSLVLNIFYFAYWIYAANISNSHQESVAKYRELVPFEIGVLLFSLLLAAFTILSIVLLTRERQTIYKVLIGVQVFFLVTYVWGAM
ncbi:MAG: hypothetical protein EOP47_22025 [Sphingobacteriaceae bacterium]|nr:MAG: hypothetical protein EOP47_22025 [Sphingobacteriaceae bacterium]